MSNTLNYNFIIIPREGEFCLPVCAWWIIGLCFAVAQVRVNRVGNKSAITSVLLLLK